MYIQGVDSVYDLAFNDAGVTYGQVFHENEVEFSAYNFEIADTEALLERFRMAAEECRRCIEAGLPLPAYDQAIKASHIFNTLQARGIISVAERAAYIARIRELAKAACAAWMEKNGWLTPSPRGGEGRGEGARPPNEPAAAEPPHPTLPAKGEGL